MKYYKESLLNKLIDTGWELIEQDNDTDWWLEESWTIKSVKENWGRLIYLLFLVDPMYEGTKKSQAVWCITATKSIPEDRLLDDGLASMRLTKGKYDKNLKNFIEELNEIRIGNSI